MKTIDLKPQTQLLGACPNTPKKNPTAPVIIHTTKSPKKHLQLKTIKQTTYKPFNISQHKASPIPDDDDHHEVFPPPNGRPRLVALGAMTLGVALVLMGVDGHHHQALALGPEGPLVEEFWDNVRRYALYALTVSTGALYTVLLPIFELLKNPISAVLVLVILGGGFYIMSQVLYAMVGVTDFSYDYGY